MNIQRKLLIAAASWATLLSLYLVFGRQVASGRPIVDVDPDALRFLGIPVVLTLVPLMMPARWRAGLSMAAFVLLLSFCAVGFVVGMGRWSFAYAPAGAFLLWAVMDGSFGPTQVLASRRW